MFSTHRLIQVGNLGYSMDDRDLARLFAPHGVVSLARVSIHRNSRQSTGYGLVAMESVEQSEAAIAALNGTMHCGRVLSLAWSTQEVVNDTPPDVLFFPMNIPIDPPKRSDQPERSG